MTLFINYLLQKHKTWITSYTIKNYKQPMKIIYNWTSNTSIDRTDNKNVALRVMWYYHITIKKLSSYTNFITCSFKTLGICVSKRLDSQIRISDPLHIPETKNLYLTSHFLWARLNIKHIVLESVILVKLQI